MVTVTGDYMVAVPQQDFIVGGFLHWSKELGSTYIKVENPPSKLDY